MFRNQYDGDIATWSPQGRIYQIEYAMEAVKQGSASVGCKSSKLVVLGALKRSSSELSSYQRKLFRLDAHCGAAISGLMADARVLCRFMRGECLNHKYVYGSDAPVGRLVARVADKSQNKTQQWSVSLSLFFFFFVFFFFL
jgi:20S proteasome subunit alpha 6